MTAQLHARLVDAVNAAPTPPAITGDVLYVSSATSGNTADVASVTVPQPSNLQIYDVVVVRLSRWTGASPDATKPAGFIFRGQTSTGAQQLDTFIKRMGGPELVPWTFTSPTNYWSTAQVMIYRGVDRDVDLTTLRLNVATASGTTVLPSTTLSAVPEGAALDWHGVNESGGGSKTSPTGWTEPAGMDNDVDASAYQQSVAAGDYTASGAVVSAASDSVISSLLELPAESTGGTNVTLGVATTTNTAFALTFARTVTLGLATSASTALPLVLTRAISLGAAAETDAAYAPTVTRARTAALGTATETDAAYSVVVARAVGVSRAQESDTAHALVASFARTVVLGAASEVDAAYTLAAAGAGSTVLGVASETDTAHLLVRSKTLTLGTATEISTASSVSRLKTLTFSPATELDAAFAMFKELIPLRDITVLATSVPVLYWAVTDIAGANISVGALTTAWSATGPQSDWEETKWSTTEPESEWSATDPFL